MKMSFVAALAAVSLLLCPRDVARAQATANTAPRTWVSGVGDDAGDCSRTAPCKTFAAAIAKTSVNGEINCLDPAGYGFLTITKSITVDCTGTFGSVLNTGSNGFNIAFDSFSGSDVRKTVNIRGIAFNGIDSGLTGIRLLGSGFNSHVVIEDVVINGDFGSDATGIGDSRTSGNLTILNSTIRNTNTAGISIKPAGGSSVIRVTLDNVKVINSGSGFTSSAGAAIAIHNSLFAQNSVVGVQVGPGAQALIENSRISHNGTGLSAAGVIRLSASSVFLNANAAVSGIVQSYSDNKFVGAIGGAIVPIGSISESTGLQ